MLEKLARKSILLVVLAFLASPVAANIPVNDALERAEEVPSDVQDAAPDPDETAPGSEVTPPSQDDVQQTVRGLPVQANDLRKAADEARTQADPVIEQVDLVLALVLSTVESLVPSDPVAMVQDRLEPVRNAANQVQVILVSESTPDEMDMAGQAAVTEIPFPTEQALMVAGATVAVAALAILWLAGSSGSVGAGAAGAAGTGSKVAATDLKRLLPFASPLFTRFEKDTVLGHPKREALYALILQTPGVSLQTLCDATGLSRTAVTHHLRLLEHQHLIVSKRMGRSRHYYENGGRFGRDQKEALAILQNGRSKQVATFVRDHPGAIQKALCEALGLQPSIAHWHLARLQQAQLVESVRSGRTVAYFPAAGLRSAEQPVVPASALAAPSMA